jgi:peptidyl-prolyl cis-trans isomerase C
MKQAEDAALDQLVGAELLYQAGSKLEIKDLDKQISDKVAQGKARFKTPEEYETALKTNNLTEKELLEIIRKDTVINNLLEDGKITAEEATRAKSTPLRLRIEPDTSPAPYFVEELRRYLEKTYGTSAEC